AHDYLMKDNLARLLPAVERELAEARVRHDRGQSQEKLRLEHTFRRTIEASIPSGIAVIDLEGRQTYVNRSFCDMVGWTEQELVDAKPPFVYWAPEDQKAMTEAFEQMMAGKVPSGGFELRFRRRNEQRFH